MNIILSIKPEWAEKIYSGEKCVEWRKTMPKRFRHCDMVFLYETAPVKKITGFLKLDGIAIIKPENLNKCHDLIELGCLEERELKKYAGGKPIYGWLIKETVRFSGEDLKEIGEGLEAFGVKRAPQSWGYCKNRRFFNE